MTLKKSISRVVSIFVQKTSAYLDDFNKAVFDDHQAVVSSSRSDADDADAAYAGARFESTPKPEPPKDLSVAS